VKLILPVPIRKVQVNPGSYTFETENRVVDVLFVSRTPANRTGLPKWHYVAHFNHPEAHPEASRVGIKNTLTCWIRRADHRHWSPPKFPDHKAGFVSTAT